MEKQMKLSSETLTVLKNFASINSGIEFKKGTKLSTLSADKTILASATIPDNFQEDFCVYDLNQFLSIYSLYSAPELSFDEKNVYIGSGRNKTTYRKTAKDMIVSVPNKEVNLPSIDIDFTLKQEDLASILKSAAVLQSDNLKVESDGEKIYVTCFNAKDNSAHTNSIEVADGAGNKYSMVFLTENFKLIPGNYQVQISQKGLALFKNKTSDIQYFITIQTKDSKFGE
jgi:hypothetical protein